MGEGVFIGTAKKQDAHLNNEKVIIKNKNISHISYIFGGPEWMSVYAGLERFSSPAVTQVEGQTVAKGKTRPE